MVYSHVLGYDMANSQELENISPDASRNVVHFETRAV